MRNLKILILSIIALGTLLSILYLSIIAKRVDKYAFSSSPGTLSFIMYQGTVHSNPASSDRGTVLNILESVKDEIKGSGYNAIILNPKSSEELRKEVFNAIKKHSKNMIIDVRQSKAIVSKNTLLIRVQGKKSEDMQIAEKIKQRLKEKNIKVNIIADTKSDMSLTWHPLVFEFAQNNNYEEAQGLILNAVYAIME